MNIEERFLKYVSFDTQSDEYSNTTPSTLKQLELGYTHPEQLTRKWGVQNLRFYLSGNNLLCFSKFKLWDPEMAGEGLGYPIQRVYNIGLNLTF